MNDLYKQFFEVGEGLVAMAKGEPRPALVWFHKALKKDPYDAMAVWGTLNAESRVGGHIHAVKLLRRLHAIEGQTPFVWATVALLRWRSGNGERARAIACKLMAKAEKTFQFTAVRRLLEAEGIN